MSSSPKPGHITITLNAKLQPQHRAELEDVFDELCEERGIGAAVCGGGTLVLPSGEVSSCDVEIEVDALDEETIEQVQGIFAAMLAPKGSSLTVHGDHGGRIEFGAHEGLALYLNGTDLPDEVYASCDVNHVRAECERLLEGLGLVNSHWSGPTETALYMYGRDAADMRRAIEPLVDSYPLCRKARFVRIA